MIDLVERVNEDEIIVVRNEFESKAIVSTLPSEPDIEFLENFFDLYLEEIEIESCISFSYLLLSIGNKYKDFKSKELDSLIDNSFVSLHFNLSELLSEIEDTDEISILKSIKTITNQSDEFRKKLLGTLHDNYSGESIFLSLLYLAVEQDELSFANESYVEFIEEYFDLGALELSRYPKELQEQIIIASFEQIIEKNPAFDSERNSLVNYKFPFTLK